MHELALGKALLQLLEKHAPAQGNIVNIQLKIGKLSYTNLDSFRFNFSIISKGSRAHKARLEILQEDGLAQCLDCLHQFTIDHYGESCPLCQHYNLKVLQGESFQLLQIIMDKST